MCVVAEEPGFDCLVYRVRQDCDDWQARWLISRSASCSLSPWCSCAYPAPSQEKSLSATWLRLKSPHALARRQGAGAGGWGARVGFRVFLLARGVCTWRGPFHYPTGARGPQGPSSHPSWVMSVCSPASRVLGLFRATLFSVSHHTGGLESRLQLCSVNEQERPFGGSSHPGKRCKFPIWALISSTAYGPLGLAFAPVIYLYSSLPLSLPSFKDCG